MVEGFMGAGGNCTKGTENQTLTHKTGDPAQPPGGWKRPKTHHSMCFNPQHKIRASGFRYFTMSFNMNLIY